MGLLTGGIGASVGCAEVGGVCQGIGRGGEDEEMSKYGDGRDEWVRNVEHSENA